MKPLLWTTVFGLAIAIAPCQTQTESVAFEVATIKPPDPTSSVVAGTSFSPRRFTGVGTLRELVQTAYGVQDYQVSGGPAWVRLERLVVDGRSANPVPHDRMMIMLQTLLKERFKLELHRETKVLPIYSLMQGALVRGRTKLHEVEDKTKAGGMASGKGMLRGQMTLSDLARYLAPVTGRPVLDRTGLTQPSRLTSSGPLTIRRTRRPRAPPFSQPSKSNSA